MKFLVCILVILVVAPCEAQTKFGLKCSELLPGISSEWKRDSLTSNGYREGIVGEILRCRIDQVDTSSLVRYLGKPVKIERFRGGSPRGDYVSYIYYYWDGYTLSNKQELIRNYISFTYDEKEFRLVAIDQGTYCG